MASTVSLSPEPAEALRPEVARSTAARRESPGRAWNDYLGRIAQGDTETLAQLYDESKNAVYGLALRILRDAPSAEEVTLDVYKWVWQNAGRFDPQRANAFAWLMMLTRSRAIDRRRSDARRSREEPLMSDLTSPKTGPEDAALLFERRRVRVALGRLSPVEREAIESAFFLGYTHSELAAKLGQPLGTIKTRIRQALLKLRDALDSELKEPPENSGRGPA
jgi:RNA polymerase sigma-70 factor (ECF subfamily)